MTAMLRPSNPRAALLHVGFCVLAWRPPISPYPAKRSGEPTAADYAGV